MMIKNGEKELAGMTVGKVCDIIGVSLPEGMDGSRPAGTVYAHPAQLKKDSVIICTSRRA